MTQLSTAMVRAYQKPQPPRLLAQQLCAKTGGVCDGKGCAGHSAASLPTMSKRSSKARKWGEV